MEHRRPNLDHIVVRVNHRDRSTQFALNKFLSNDGLAATIRASSHYYYEGIRKYLLNEIALPSIEPLVFGETHEVNSQNELELLIINIQMGNSSLPSLQGSRIPGLILCSKPIEGSAVRPGTVIEHAITKANSTGGSQSTKRRRIESSLQSLSPETNHAEHLKPQAKRRKIEPQLLTQDGPRSQFLRPKSVAYFQGAGLSSYDILYHECDTTCGCDDREFHFQRDDTARPGHRIQVNRLFKRAANVHRRYPSVRYSSRHNADSVVPLHNPFDNEVLPLYGESDQEYDTDTWDEIQKELQEERNNRQRQSLKILTPQEVNTILDEVTGNYETAWREERLSLLHQELPTWQKLHQGSVRKTDADLSKTLQMLDSRTATIRHKIATANPWSTKSELVRAAASLEPSIRDRLKTQWKLKLVNQDQKPEGTAAPPPQRKTRANSSQEDVISIDTEEDLTSGSEDIPIYVSTTKTAVAAVQRLRETVDKADVLDNRAHGADKMVDSEYRLQDALEKYDPTMQDLLFEKVGGTTDALLWQNTILSALAYDSLPTVSTQALSSTETKDLFVAKHLIRLFDIYAGQEVASRRQYSRLPEAEKTRIRGNESQFQGFVRLLLSLLTICPEDSEADPLSLINQAQPAHETFAAPGQPFIRSSGATENDVRDARAHVYSLEAIEPSSDVNNEKRPNELAQRGGSVDDEDASENVANDGFGGRHANRYIDDYDWKRLCHLFQCPESTTKLKPPGFHMELPAYQLHAIWWMLTQQPLRGIQGGCLGDAMGLGKTIEVISTYVMFAMIKANHEEVRRFWKDGSIAEGRRHLAEKQTGEDSQCPSQKTSPYPTLCTCIKSGDAYKIAVNMPALPIICVLPPTVIKSWVSEYKKLIDTTHSIAGHFKLSVWHGDYMKDEQLYHGEHHLIATGGVAVQRRDADGNMQLLLRGRAGLSNHLILVSRHSTIKFHARYANMRTSVREEDGSLKMVQTNLLGAAFVFFDEAHQYNGSLDSPTDPFQFLDRLRNSSIKEPSAFAVSASIPLKGPAYLVNIVDHILESRFLQGGEAEIGGISNAKHLETRQTDYSYLIDKLHRATDPKIKKEIEARRKILDKLKTELIPLVLMARRPIDTFRGEQIGDGSREIVVRPVNCKMKSSAAQKAFARLTAEVRSYVYRAFQNKKQEWEQDGRIGPEPSEHSVEISLFGSGEGDNIWARLSGRTGQAWTRLLRAGVYPALARLIEANLIQDEDLYYGTLNEVGAKACKMYFTTGWAKMVEVLKQSRLWKYRGELAKESSKFNRLCAFVDDMIAYRNRRPTADDPGPRDGTNIRHMVILAVSPSSAFITYMQLARRYPHARVILINAATKNEAGVSDAGYGRSQIIDDLNSPCDPASPNKILISTYAICGVALNLQRANYCIMLEPASTMDVEKQAAARVNRRGQDMKPVTVMLYDERNFPESVRLSRRANHEEILSWKEGIPWNRFTEA